MKPKQFLKRMQNGLGSMGKNLDMEPAEVIDSFTCNGRLWVIHEGDLEKYRVSDYLSGYWIDINPDECNSLIRIKKEAVRRIEANKGFNYKRYKTINKKP